MQTPTNNKSATTATARCPKCGAHAREVSTGWFCAEHGLVLDESRNLRPSPDPISEALRVDPARLAAHDRKEQAEAAYAAATDAWTAVLSELHTVRIKARNDQGEFPPFGAGPWRPSKAVRVLRQREAELVDQLEVVAREREHTAGSMRIARRQYQETAAAASGRLGRPVITGNVRGGERDLIIPQV